MLTYHYYNENLKTLELETLELETSQLQSLGNRGTSRERDVESECAPPNTSL